MGDSTFALSGTAGVPMPWRQASPMDQRTQLGRYGRGRAGRLGGAREAEVGEDGAGHGWILDAGEDAQPAGPGQNPRRAPQASYRHSLGSDRTAGQRATA